MPLRFRVEVTRGIPRVTVLRIHKDNQGKENLEVLGAFGKRKSPDLIRDKLTEDELYEFENYLSSLDFSKKFFHKEADELDRLIIKVAPEFKKIIQSLWQHARKFDLDFVPEKEMLYAVLNKAKTIEHKVNRLSGKRINLLEKINIDISEPSDVPISADENKKLFVAILELCKDKKSSEINYQYLATICEEFENIAQKIYGKNAKFKPHHLEFYAKPESRFPKWYYTVAIDLLLKHGINPITIIPPQKVAKHWARERVNKISLEKAQQNFLDTFKPSSGIKGICFDMINAIYLTKETN